MPLHAPLIKHIKNDIQEQTSYLKCIYNTKRVNFVTEIKLSSCRCRTVPTGHRAPAENKVWNIVMAGHQGKSIHLCGRTTHQSTKGETYPRATLTVTDSTWTAHNWRQAFRVSDSTHYSIFINCIKLHPIQIGSSEHIVFYSVCTRGTSPAEK
jgi:hypothetical protein